MDLAFLPATEQARLVRSREVSSLELVRLYLERIERLDPQLNSFVTVCGEEALAEAEMRDTHSGDGPFHGVPIAIKDLTATAGIRTTYSCRAFADNVPDFDTAVVRRVREAGFVIVGKTNTPEFGTVAFTESELNGSTSNPWSPELTPGRLERRRGCGARGGPRADRARQRRRRLDPHPVVVLRPLRAEAVARPRLERAVLLVRRAFDRRLAREVRRGRRRVPRRGLRLRAGRRLVGAAARAPLRGGARCRSRPSPNRGRLRRLRSTYP